MDKRGFVKQAKFVAKKARERVHSIDRLEVKAGARRKIRGIIRSGKGLERPLPDSMIKEIGKFWTERIGLRISPLWHQAYINVNGVADPRYVPEDIFYLLIEPALNDRQMRWAYSDKNLYSQWLPRELLPTTMLRRIHGRYYSEQYELLTPSEIHRQFAAWAGRTVVIKPSLLSWGGRSVHIFLVESGRFQTNEGAAITLEGLERQYGNNFVIQECLQQAKVLDTVYANAVNTVRITTLRYRNDIIVLSSVIKFGSGGSHVDNQSSGGVSSGLREDGSMMPFSVDRNGNKFLEHPDSGVAFGSLKIPGVKDLYELASLVHEKIIHCDLASHDFALDNEHKWKFIEVNLWEQGLNFHQFNNGPLFGDLTEAILKRAVAAKNQPTVIGWSR